MIVFLPGGMASQLKRVDGKRVWLANEFHFLKIDPDGSDYQGMAIEPDGPIAHLYNDFIEWCEQRHPFLTFAWDWRRGVKRAAARFLETIEPDLPPYTLIGHSAGGMVAKIIANHAPPKMKQVITVGTPFFGCGNQIHLYDSPVAEIAASLPGGYEFLFLDRALYKEHAEKFKSDEYPLWEYPGTDLYPPSMRTDLMLAGRTVARDVAKPLPDGVNSKLTCIRGIQRRDNLDLMQTVVRHRLSGGKIINILGPGDGVEAAWSARLPGANLITIADDISHETMLNAECVQEKIATLLSGVD